MQDFRSTVLVGTPSYALRIAEALDHHDVPLSSLHLRWGMFGSAVIGLALTGLMVVITEYYTGTEYSPVRTIANRDNLNKMPSFFRSTG